MQKTEQNRIVDSDKPATPTPSRDSMILTLLADMDKLKTENARLSSDADKLRLDLDLKNGELVTAKAQLDVLAKQLQEAQDELKLAYEEIESLKTPAAPEFTEVEMEALRAHGYSVGN